MKLFVVLLLLLGLAFATQKELDSARVIVGASEGVDLSEHFFISVEHIEDVFEDEKLIAERDIAVALRFDVSPSYDVTVNGIPVKVGFSELKVDAQVVEVDAVGKASPFLEPLSIVVRVYVGFETVTAGGNTFRRVLIQERIVEAEGKKVWQADINQQVFDVHGDGSVHKFAVQKVAAMISESEQPSVSQPSSVSQPPSIPEPPVSQPPVSQPSSQVVYSEVTSQSHEHGHHGHNSHHKHLAIKVCQYIKDFKNWFHNLSFIARIAVSFTLGIVSAFVVSLVVKGIVCTFRFLLCKRKQNAYKDRIREYSLQYTSVPQSEKAEKKIEQV